MACLIVRFRVLKEMALELLQVDGQVLHPFEQRRHGGDGPDALAVTEAQHDEHLNARPELVPVNQPTFALSFYQIKDC
jgi:hypothetical protein